MPSDFSRATCYLSIEEVAKAFPKKFFTRSNLKGIRIEGEGDQQKYLERRIRAGSVLETKGKIFLFFFTHVLVNCARSIFPVNDGTTQTVGHTTVAVIPAGAPD